ARYRRLGARAPASRLVTAATFSGSPRRGWRRGPCRYATLQRPQERDKIMLLLLGEAQVEPLAVEVHGVGQRGRRAVVEVRRAAGEPTQDRALEAAHVFPLAGDERPPGVGHDLGLPGRLVTERVDRHVIHGEPELVV